MFKSIFENNNTLHSLTNRPTGLDDLLRQCHSTEVYVFGGCTNSIVFILAFGDPTFALMCVNSKAYEVHFKHTTRPKLSSVLF